MFGQDFCHVFQSLAWTTELTIISALWNSIYCIHVCTVHTHISVVLVCGDSGQCLRPCEDFTPSFLFPRPGSLSSNGTIVLKGKERASGVLQDKGSWTKLSSVQLLVTLHESRRNKPVLRLKIQPLNSYHSKKCLNGHYWDIPSSH